MSPGPDFLYRAFDADDRLLYVGVTGNLRTRKRIHATQSAWYSDAVRWTCEQYPSRFDSLAAERHAITTEKPLHNVPGSERARRAAATKAARKAVGA